MITRYSVISSGDRQEVRVGCSKFSKHPNCPYRYIFLCVGRVGLGGGSVCPNNLSSPFPVQRYCKEVTLTLAAVAVGGAPRIPYA